MKLKVDLNAKAAYVELEPSDNVNLDVNALDHRLATFNLIDVLNSIDGLGREPIFVGIEFLDITSVEITGV